MNRASITNALFLTFFIFAVMFALSNIPLNMDFLDPIGNALTDFEMSDMVFSRFRDDAAMLPDTNIVLVNVGSLKRHELAALIQILNAQEPAVLALDVFFRQEKGPQFDIPLRSALTQVKHLVLVSQLAHYNEQLKRFDSLQRSHPMFMTNARTGFANVVASEDAPYKTWRSFSPRERLGDSSELAFASAIVQQVDPHALKCLLDRGNDIETINFHGNTDKFLALDVQEVFNPAIDKRFIKGKIVMLGYMGEQMLQPSLEDKFYTPMNERYAGKTVPDMYGVVVHANIVSMICSGSYINTMPDWLSKALAIVVCFFNALLFYQVKNRFDEWYGAASKILILVETIVVLFLYIYIFNAFVYKIDLVLALIAAALTPDMLEIYEGSVKNVLHKLKQKHLLKGRLQ
jgi:CHASE2 domain-containing sensor protein